MQRKKMITEYELSKIFHDHDPMHTQCCVNSGMGDEYDSEARNIIFLLEQGVPFKTALHDVFSFFFWDGCLTCEGLMVATIVSQYYNNISKYSA